MNIEHFIAQRLNSPSGGSRNLSRPFIRIATVAVALSLAVMIISVGVIIGFKKEITEKTIGFGSHIQIVNYDSNISFETNPIESDLEFIPDIKAIRGVRHIQVFAVKPGIIKTDSDIQGVVLKGVSHDFDWSFFKKNLVDGQILSLPDSAISNDAIISKATSLLLKLKVGDSFDMFFVQEPPRVRRFAVSGIFDSQMTEFDRLFVLGDIRHIQRLNGWEQDQVTGFELLIDDFKEINNITYQVEDIVIFNFLEDGSRLRVMNIVEKYPQIFDWLGLQDINVVVLLALMLIVAGINMISGLLIIILERTNMIGLLKALGAENRVIRNIFLIQSGQIVARGLLWGNIFGLAIAFIQIRFGIIKLDPENYYLSTVPIDINLINIILLNLGTFLLTLTMLLVPSMVISRISPDKTIKFD